MNLYKYTFLFILAGMSAGCVEDETNYNLMPVNEVSIGGLEEKYYGMAYSDVIEIKPEVTGSLNGDDLSNYEYVWYRCGTNHAHDTIGREKNLKWLANVPPGTHSIYLTVKDKVTGYDKIAGTRVQLSSPFTRGFLIFGNRPHTDNLIGLDMLTMIEGKNDTIYVKDVFDNSEHQLKYAKQLIYTGNNNNNRFYLQTEDETYSSTFRSEFETLGSEFNNLGIIECLEPHKIPMKLVDVAMCQGVHRPSPLIQTARAYLTEDQAFAHRSAERMTQPLNRYSENSSLFFNFYPKIFYNTRKQTNAYISGMSTSLSPIVLYDTDHDCFAYYIGTGLTFTHMGEIPNSNVLRQTGIGIYMSNAPDGRTLVYGENDYRPANGRCNFIIRDDYDNYFLYRFVLGWPGMAFGTPTPNITEPFSCKLDIASMPDFLNREHIFFASGASSLIYYSVGNILYAYDYIANKVASRQYEGNITYLAPEVCSLTDQNKQQEEITHYWVATFDGDKGHLYKLRTEENANKIEFIDLPNQNWEIDLEIKSVLWKGGVFYTN